MNSSRAIPPTTSLMYITLFRREIYAIKNLSQGCSLRLKPCSHLKQKLSGEQRRQLLISKNWNADFGITVKTNMKVFSVQSCTAKNGKYCFWSHKQVIILSHTSKQFPHRTAPCELPGLRRTNEDVKAQGEEGVVSRH